MKGSEIVGITVAPLNVLCLCYSNAGVACATDSAVIKA